MHMLRALLALSLATPLGSAVAQSLCDSLATAEGARCISVSAPENWTTRRGRSLSLRVMVLPPLPRGSAATQPPLVLIQGGPGVAGLPMARTFAPLADLRQGRELVFFDARGVGESGALTCEGLPHDRNDGLLPPKLIAECHRRLSGKADLAQYTSNAIARDLDGIRQQLGWERFDVAGFSGGTRVAMNYARLFPTRARTIVLDGVVPYDADMTTEAGHYVDRAIDWLIQGCEKNSDCRRAYPFLRAQYDSLSQRLRARPAPVSVGGQRFTYGTWELAYTLRGMLYGPPAARVPRLITQAQQSGDLTELATLYFNRTAWVTVGTGIPLYLGIYCGEDVPFERASSTPSSGTLMGDAFHRQYAAACAEWPIQRVDSSFRRPLASRHRVLLFSGERDPVTPPAYGERVARSLPNARHITIPHGGHSVQSPCKARVIDAFLRGALDERISVCILNQPQPVFETPR
jgi:pimeloyl-ACP methyl ester carboxylesterase